jgi:AcrR family transcriptional regulator
VTTTRTRLSPQQRRAQLLDLGVQLLSEVGLEDLSTDLLAEQAGISRGLLYHYFSNKRDFHLAVLRRMADQVIEITAPTGVGSPLDQMASSLEAYVDFVAANRLSYAAFLRAAAGGDESYHRIYEDSRRALTDRIFDPDYVEFLASVGLRDDARSRLVVRGWSSLVEEMVLSWLEHPESMSRERLLRLLTGALPALATTDD